MSLKVGVFVKSRTYCNPEIRSFKALYIRHYSK